MFIVDSDVVTDVISACMFRTFPAPVLNVDIPSADEWTPGRVYLHVTEKLYPPVILLWETPDDFQRVNLSA